MWALFVLLCFFITPTTFAFRNNEQGTRKQQPRLKAGRNAHASRITRNKRSNGRMRMSIAVSDDQSVVLDLEPNVDLLSASYQEIEILPSGWIKKTHRRRSDVVGCWYHGSVAGERNSSVLVSDCDGVEGLIQRQDGSNLIVKSVGETDDDVAVYNLEDEEEVKGSCGVHNKAEHSLDAHEEPLHTISTRRLLDYDTSVNVIEIAVVSDYKYIQGRGGAYGRNLTQVANLNVQVIAFVQATYAATSFSRPTSVRLKGQYFFSNGDPYSITLDSNGEVDEGVLLDKFTNWTQSLVVNYDHVMLLTYHDFLGDTIGFAHTQSICTSVKTAVSEASNTPLQVANTVAHEMGHVLGMFHDGQTGPPDTSSCSSEGFVMATTNSCPLSGLCPFSSCSVSSKNTWTNGVSCLYTWAESLCGDGIWNGNETGIDCGGSCPACTAQAGCVNNGGCEETCTPLGSSSFVCSCSPPKYLDPLSGTACFTDIDQCASTSTNVCEGGCTNLLGGGGAYSSFLCNCTSPLVLSPLDGVSCHSPSCFDRIKNQNEIMTDCGGVCTSRLCGCVISSANWQYVYDKGVTIANAQWQTQWNDTSKYLLMKHGVPVRYLYKSGSSWYYDNDLQPDSYFGVLQSPSLTPPSSSAWRIYNGVDASFPATSFTFASCSSVTTAVCGNGVLEGGEVCDSCAVFSGGVCVMENPCCDSTCLATRVRGLACRDKEDLLGACWDGDCITRNSACDTITTVSCFGSGCATGTGGGQTCGALPDMFSSASCASPFVCYVDCVKTQMNGEYAIGATRGFPCSTPDSSGVYPSVCDGGLEGNGKNSSCVPVASLTNYLTLSPTSAPATKAPATAAPTAFPTTAAPTPFPTTKAPTTAAPTPLPTTPAPTAFPTTGQPTHNPTTSGPVTSSPTKHPTTGVPSFSPTSSSPSTISPTRTPTTHMPTLSPSTRSPATFSPSLSPTTLSPTTLSPTHVPTTPTTFVPTFSPTLNITNTTQPPTKAADFLGIAGLPAEYSYFYYGGAAVVIMVLIFCGALCLKAVCCRRKAPAPRLRKRHDDIELDG